ncbi:MAG: RHS repeat-associated core domain-containing protein [Pyrinomonadaceae bacterium]
MRKRFTGYEKDDETGLDFAEARMYQNKHGRFTAVDPLLASASATNPQTFNRYTYTGNNPINYTDPSGLSWCLSNEGEPRFTGEGKPCPKDEGGITWENVDGQKLRRTEGSGGLDSNGNQYGVGSVLYFHPDGRRTVVPSSPQNQATAQGRSVADATSNTAGQTAAQAAASNAAPASAGSETGGSSGMLSLCAPRLECLPNKDPIIIDLTHGASAEELLDATQFFFDGVAATEIPIASQATGLLSAGIDFGRGDHLSGLMGLGGLIPIAGNYLDGAKIARRAGRLGGDATRKQIDEIANTLVDKGYTIERGGGRDKEEYLKAAAGRPKGRFLR